MENYSPYRAGHSYIKKHDIVSKDPARHAQYREQYEQWPKEHRVADFPTHLDLELSSACNLHCPMCHTVYIEDPSFKKFKEHRMLESLMSFDLFKKAIDEATQYNHFHSIKLNFRGESALHPDIVKFIDYAKQRGVFDIMLNSNGNYDIKLTEEMMEAGLTWLSISLDAINPHTYDKVRAGGNFYRAYATAIDMCRFVDRANVQVSFVRQKANAAEEKEFVAFWEKFPIHKIVIGDFYNPGEMIKNDSAFVVLNYKKSDKFSCPQIWQRILIWNNGNMYPCCQSFEGPDDLFLGNLSDTSIHDAWHSDKLTAIRKCHEVGDYSKVSTCSKCSYPKQKVQISIDNIVS